ncbi:HTH-type transcriptional repressor NsrR [Comamonas sp. PE63]|uniref:HTH-type transcriptional repressor NsrR n=1 Tax=Comamonas brasiliensis TaxID=1812482 RepID=A0ABS5LPS9_9BURK|nr:HTH-type transcriptional repressor NsrR [Comamonas sp. PE63]
MPHSDPCGCARFPSSEQAYEVSEARLIKVTHQLALQGWIVAVRCKEGGMCLAHMTQQINIDAVVLGMESDFVLVECFDSDD